MPWVCADGAASSAAGPGPDRPARWDASIRPVPPLDQGPPSRQHRRAAGVERGVEQMIQSRLAQDPACVDAKVRRGG
jgi:hypothetical protein